MSIIGLILVILLVMLLFGSLPTWQYSRNWGPYPSSALFVLVVVLAVLLLMGRI